MIARVDEIIINIGKYAKPVHKLITPISFTSPKPKPSVFLKSKCNLPINQIISIEINEQRTELRNEILNGFN